MKRKQFHLSDMEEEVLRRLSKESGQSEAEIVREAIKEYGKKRLTTTNPLVKMANEAEKREAGAAHDLSIEHDKHLVEILENEK